MGGRTDRSDLRPAEAGLVIGHRDLGPWNIIGDGERPRAFATFQR